MRIYVYVFFLIRPLFWLLLRIFSDLTRIISAQILRVFDTWGFVHSLSVLQLPQRAFPLHMLEQRPAYQLGELLPVCRSLPARVPRASFAGS